MRRRSGACDRSVWRHIGHHCFGGSLCTVANHHTLPAKALVTCTLDEVKLKPKSVFGYTQKRFSVKGLASLTRFNVRRGETPRTPRIRSSEIIFAQWAYELPYSSYNPGLKSTLTHIATNASHAIDFGYEQTNQLDTSV